MSERFTCPDCEKPTNIDGLVRQTYSIKGYYRCVDCEAERMIRNETAAAVSGDFEIREPTIVMRLLRWVFG